MKLIDGNIAVKMDPAKEMSDGGIVMPQRGATSRTGTVTIVGPGEFRDGNIKPMTVKVGDRVLLDSYSANELKIKGDVVRIVDETDVIAILEEGDE